ncbi:MAG TPA: hypothetical protein RMH99_32695 [Sandaracinaceae bacterium LLY-WYZ-13_1]|nr:hypothetical protein [Sandaracinaceae bacterium LLY-WYZ-13_1]
MGASRAARRRGATLAFGLLAAAWTGDGHAQVENAPSEPTERAPSEPVLVDATPADPAGGAATGPVSVDFGPTRGLVVESDALDARFELHFATWIRAELDAPDGQDAIFAFDVPLARPLLQISLFENRIRLLFQPELAGASPTLLDLQLELELDPAFVIRIGQFRTPYSRAFITPIVTLTFPDRGFVDDTFRLDRDTGLMLSGITPGGVFEYAAGVFNGALINGNLGDLPAPTAIVRLGLNLGDHIPMDQVPSLAAERDLAGGAIAVGAAYRRWRVPADSPTGLAQESGHLQTDWTLALGPVTATAEGFLRFTRDELATDWSLAWGSFAQVGVMVVPRWLEVAARGGWMDPDADASGNFIQIYEVGLSLYPVIDDLALGHHLKAQLRYAYERAADAFGTRIVEGDRHRVMLQIQAWM